MAAQRAGGAMNRAESEAAERIARLEATLRELEAACDVVCALRTPDVYRAMLEVRGTQDALLRLDAARKAARDLVKP
jgi:hypothetical protein